MKSVEIRESLKRGADLGSVRICTASRCQRVGGVHMMHQVPSRIMHICNDESFQCQVILYTLGACEHQGSSAKLSRQLHPVSLLLSQEGHLIHLCAYVRFPEPSSAKRACQRLQYPRPRPCLAGCATHEMT